MVINMNGMQRRLCWLYFRKTIYTLFVGIVGSLIGAYFQYESWEKKNDFARLEYDRQRAEEIFSEISSIMDDRLYKTVRLSSAYKQKDKEKINRYKDSFVLQLEEWNSNINRLNALLEGYYGVEFSRYFMLQIQHNFALCGNMIAYSPENQIQKIDSITNILRPKIFNLNKMMINAIKEDKIGRFS